ncbi:MAG: YceI family protein [Phototrophicaceae bacterium]
MSRIIRISLSLLVVAIAVSVGLWAYLNTGAQVSTSITQLTDQQITPVPNGTVFRLDQTRSYVEYQIDEVLSGNPIVVIGQTNQVDGFINLDPTNPNNSTLSTLFINARNFKTDNSNRDGAVRRFILKSDQAANEFITFEPSAFSALPTELVIGQPITFQVSGTLTLLGKATPITFDGEATLTSETELIGSAETTVKWSDLGVEVFRVPPQVAEVGEDVTLRIIFWTIRVEA